MIEQERRLREPSRTPARARLAGALAALLLALALAVGIALSVGGAPARAGLCVQATVASTTGGAQIHVCGPAARSLCAAPGNLAGNQALAQACARVGLPFDRRD
jgi:hypothetical protein